MRRLPVADPLAFLRAIEGEARGFWGRRDRWVAWGGARVRIEVARGSGTDRFARVREEARRALDEPEGGWGRIAVRDRPRFFGGFSFVEERGTWNGGGKEGDAPWSAYPAAAFVLPRVALEARDGEVRLLAGPADSETDGLLRRVEAELGRPPSPPRGNAAPGVAALSPLPAESDAEARGRWESAVRSVLDAVEDGRVRKAVIARFLDVPFPGSVDPIESLRFLRSENIRAHVYLLELRPGKVFLGAAPEILAELRGGRFRATAVAGSVPRGADVKEDRVLADRLLGSEKDRDEHRLTAEEMAEVLEARLEGMEVEDEPRVLTLARIQHLETEIRGTPGPGEDILSLVEALHPTPAVCGRPRAAAFDLIRAAEPFDRGWYSGPVGWFDPAGEGDFVPALRAAAGGGKRWRLFAGAGIVAGSEPAAEWDETALKLEPALRALRAGVGGDPEGAGGN